MMGPVKLTKLGHACVRVEKDGRAIVIDPGVYSPEPAALDGVVAVLASHEHTDHFDADRLRRAQADNPDLRIYSHPDTVAAYPDLRIEPVRQGDRFTVAGFDVRVHGDRHALVHPDIPRGGNVGFLLDGEVFHPGDAWTVPDEPVPTLLTPCDGPWIRAADMVDYLGAVKPARAYSIHDAYASDLGMEYIVAGYLEWAAERSGGDLRLFRTGDVVEL